MKPEKFIYIKNDGNTRWLNGVLIENIFCLIVKEGYGKSWQEGGFTPDGDGDVWTEYEHYRDIYKPAFAKELCDKYALWDKAQQVKTFDDLDAETRKVTLQLGNSEVGELIRESEYEARQEKEKADKLQNEGLSINVYVESKPHDDDLSNVILNSPVPNKGAFLVPERIIKKVWSKIKQNNSCWFLSSDDLEEFDMFFSRPGWRYNLDALQILFDNNYTLRIEGIVEIDKIDNLKWAFEKVYQIRLDEQKKVAEFYKKYHEFETKMDKLFSDAEMPKDCSEVEGSKAIHLLNAKGSNIYGGGKWFHLTDNHFWKVVNNGSDGDNWSYNNYRTGGAGAIAVKIPRTEKVDNLINEIRKFEKESIE